MSLAVTSASLRTATGVDLTPSPATRRPLPWYARAVVGGAAWLAALMFLAFVSHLDILDDAHFAHLGIGVAVVGAVLRRLDLPWPDFKDQLALVMALTGRALVAVGLYELTGSRVAMAGGMVVFESALLLAFPDGLQRLLSTVSVASWALLSLTDDPGDPVVDVLAVGAVGAALSLWAGRLRLEQVASELDCRLGWAPRQVFDRRLFGSLVTPVAYGLTAFSLALQLRFVVAGDAELTTATGVGFAVVGAVLVTWLVFTHPLRWSQRLVALVGVIAMGVVAVRVPGLLLATSFALVGLRSRLPRLVGLACTFLVLYGIYLYYQLDLSLLVKGGLLVVSGLLFLAVRLVMLRAPAAEGSLGSPRPRILCAVGVVVALGYTGSQVVGHERVLVQGQTVYLRLAPVDPRSLVQGDFMRLDYEVSRDLTRELRKDRRIDEAVGAEGTAVLSLDDRGIGTLARLDDGSSLGVGEHRLGFETRSRWVRLATHAYLFQEGHASVYEDAVFGEFAVMPSGRAVLVALTDGDLDRLGPPRQRW